VFFPPSLKHRCDFASFYFALPPTYLRIVVLFELEFLHFYPHSSSAQRAGACNTSGSGTDLPGTSGAVEQTHGPLPENASLFMGFAFMLTASSETDRLTNKLASDDDHEGEWQVFLFFLAF